jgi:hypothetical protein
MATGGGVRVEGLAALQRDLLALGVELDDLKDVMGSLARRGASLAASFAPRRSGALAASIRGNRAKNAAIVSAGTARVPYAGAINYGWRRQHITPALFLQRADEAMRPHVAQDLDQAITRLIAERGMS